MSEKMNNLIMALHKQTKAPKEDITKDVKEVLANLEKQKFTGDVNTIVKNVIISKYRKVKASPFKKQSKYKLGTFLGFKIGDLGMIDRAAEMRKWAKYHMENRGREWCEKQQIVRMVEGQLRVLDTREKIFGRPNKNFSQPLDPKLKLRERNIILLAKQADEKNYMYTRLQTSDNRLALAWSQLPEHKLVTFPASITAQDQGGYRLSSSSAKDTLTVFRAVKEELDAYKEFTKVMDPLLTELNNVFKYHKATAKAWDRWVVVRGIVSSINVEYDSYRGIPGILIDSEMGHDPDYSVKFYIPEHLKIGFGQYSEIYLIGKTRGTFKTSDEPDPKTGKKTKTLVGVSIDAWGFMPVPGKTTAPKTSLLEPEEEEISGFFE